MHEKYDSSKYYYRYLKQNTYRDSERKYLLNTPLLILSVILEETTSYYSRDTHAITGERYRLSYLVEGYMMTEGRKRNYLKREL